MLRTTIIASCAAAAMACGFSALASTTGSWTALYAASDKACMAEVRRLTSLRTTGRVAERAPGIVQDRYFATVYDTASRYGTERFLCLYDKRAKSASAAALEKLAAPKR